MRFSLNYTKSTTHKVPDDTTKEECEVDTPMRRRAPHQPITQKEHEKTSYLKVVMQKKPSFGKVNLITLFFTSTPQSQKLISKPISF